MVPSRAIPAAGSPREVPVSGDLLPHQEEGARWLAERERGYLADEPGLGKTRTIIKALQFRRIEAPLVVCPAAVRTHWAREFAAMRFAGEPRIRSYEEIVNAAYRTRLDISGADALVVDEAHYCKNVTAQRTRAIFGRDGLARGPLPVYCASGTPVPRNPGELAPVLLGAFPHIAARFRLAKVRDVFERYCVVRRYCVRGVWREKVVGVQNAEEFRELCDAMMLRRRPALDRLWWQMVRLDGPSEGRVSATEAPLVVSALNHDDLASIASDPSVSRMRRRLGEAKAPLLAKLLIDQIEDTDEQVVVLFQHRSVGKVLEAAFARLGVTYVDGDTSPSQREGCVAAFRDGTARVFLGQQQACGTGLDGLQVARRVVLVEPSWAAYENVQAAKRIDRMGQQSPHVVAQMVCLANTLDEAIVGQNRRETEMVSQVLPAGERVDAA